MYISRECVCRSGRFDVDILILSNNKLEKALRFLNILQSRIYVEEVIAKYRITRFISEKEKHVVMIPEETNLENIKRTDRLREKLGEMFETRPIQGEEFFRSKNGTYFRPVLLIDFGAVVLEYGDMEDGDLFYLEDLTDEELLESVIREIEM